MDVLKVSELVNFKTSCTKGAALIPEITQSS